MLQITSQFEAVPVTTSRASALKRTVQAALVAAVLVPLGSIADEAEAITCGFDASNEEYGGEGCFNSSGNSNTFDFVDYWFELTFLGMSGTFDVRINDAVITSQEAFDARVALPASYDCVTLVAPTVGDSGCRDFEIFVEGAGEYGWEGYELEIFWLYPTDLIYPNGPDNLNGQVRVLQNLGSEPGDLYTIDMCVEYGCEYFPKPIEGEDPSIRTKDTDFSSMTVAWTPVPEPSTLLLLGLGVSGVLYRGRRRPPV